MRPNEIYLATVGIDKNRWTKDKRPSIDLAAWLPRIASAGFDGAEVWEYHVAHLSPDELARLSSVALECGCPMPILNTYVPTQPGAEHVARRQRLDAVAAMLGASAYKFNVSGNSRDGGIAFARAWAAGNDVTFLCECHPGTMMEDPAVASSVLRELGRGRFGAILHTITADDDVFERELELEGDLVRHVHVQNADQHCDRIAARVQRLRKLGTPLTWSIEFASVVRAGGDNEACFDASVEDMKFLRSCLR